MTHICIFFDYIFKFITLKIVTIKIFYTWIFGQSKKYITFVSIKLIRVWD